MEAYCFIGIKNLLYVYAYTYHLHFISYSISSANEFTLLEFFISSIACVLAMQVSWYWYLLLGFADAQGCYLGK